MTQNPFQKQMSSVNKPPKNDLSRRSIIQGVGSSLILLPSVSKALPKKLLLHNLHGAEILSTVLSDLSYWDGTSKTKYEARDYDEIRLRSLERGYLALVTGEGKQDFIAEDVANTIYANQDLIPQFMPSLKSAVYLESGIDPFNNYPYNDIYFIADLKVMYISVALRTYKIQVSRDVFICPIEQITPQMVGSDTWATYKNIYKKEQQKLQPLSFYESIVEPNVVFGMYLIEKGKKRKSRVTMVTQLSFDSEDSFIAYVASELPFFLKQGMQVGFESSVQACVAYMEQRKQMNY